MKKIFIILFSIVLTTSCGSRKVEKESKKKEIDKEIKVDSISKKESVKKELESSNVKVESSTKTDDKGEVTTKETTYELIDITKPGKYIDEEGNSNILDNIKKSTKETVLKNNKIIDQLIKKDSTGIRNSETRLKDSVGKVVVNKDNSNYSSNSKTVTKSSNYLFLLWLLIPIGIIVVLYILYKKYSPIIQSNDYSEDIKNKV